MYLRTFLYILICTAFLTITGYYINENFLTDKPVPDTPCSMEIVNGDFINDQYERYQFSGAVTLWLKNNLITAFGVYSTSDGMKKLNRTLLLDSVIQDVDMISGNIKSVNISSSDQISSEDNFFGGKGEHITLRFSKIKHGEYLVKINNNWISICKVY